MAQGQARGVQGERRIARHRHHPRRGLGLESLVVEDLVGQADAAGLGAVEGARRQEQVHGPGRAQHVAHALDAVERITQPQARGRHAETRAGVAIAQIAGQGQAQASAHANPADHRDGGNAAVGQGLLGRAHGAVVAGHLARIIAQPGEFGNIGAGDKSAFALALQHDDAQIGVVLGPDDDGAKRLPHRQRHRVQARGVGNAHAQHACLRVGLDTARRMMAHDVVLAQTTPASCRRRISWSP